MSKNKCNDYQIEDAIISHYLKRFGTSASMGIRHPKFKVFSNPSIDGIIGYRIEHNCAVTLGDPLCCEPDKIALAKAFNHFCQDSNNQSIYTMTSEQFANAALSAIGGSILHIGHEIIIDPTVDPTTLTGHYASQLRQKRRNALANGLSTHEYLERDPLKEEMLMKVATIWLSQRKGLQSFIEPLALFDNRANKRWFYVQKDSNIISFLMLSKLEKYDGWLLNNGIALTPEAPASTTEFLILSVLEKLRNEGSIFFSTGPMPSSSIERIEGFNWLSHKIVSYGAKSILKILNLNERQRFWNKFLPRKEPIFMIFSSPYISTKQTLAILKTVNVGFKKK